MSTAEERKELDAEPLPADEQDLLIPTRIARINESLKTRADAIKFLKDEMASMIATRNELLARAKKLAITQDASFKIVEVPIYGDNHVDVPTLARLAPDDFTKIRERIRTSLQADFNAGIAKMDTFIPQSEVKAVIKDKALLVQIIPPNTEVERYDISIVPR